MFYELNHLVSLKLYVEPGFQRSDASLDHMIKSWWVDPIIFGASVTCSMFESPLFLCGQISKLQTVFQLVIPILFATRCHGPYRPIHLNFNMANITMFFLALPRILVSDRLNITFFRVQRIQ